MERRPSSSASSSSCSGRTAKDVAFLAGELIDETGTTVATATATAQIRGSLLRHGPDVRKTRLEELREALGAYAIEFGELNDEEMEHLIAAARRGRV